jgi:hypothetical protein
LNPAVATCRRSLLLLLTVLAVALSSAACYDESVAAEEEEFLATSVPDPNAMPYYLRGVWREGEGDSLDGDKCRNDRAENRGKVLTVELRSFSFFDEQGSIVEVHQHREGPGHIDATFAVTVAGVSTEERLIFDEAAWNAIEVSRVDEDGSVSAPVRYVRCYQT